MLYLLPSTEKIQIAKEKNRVLMIYRKNMFNFSKYYDFGISEICPKIAS